MKPYRGSSDYYESVADQPTLVVTGWKVGLLFSEGARDPIEQARITIAFELEDPPHGPFLFELPIAGADKLAAKILGAVEAWTQVVVREHGISEQERQRVERKAGHDRRAAQRDGREQIMGGITRTTCHACGRLGVITVDGTHYCKRHADEAGVRPRGKVT